MAEFCHAFPLSIGHCAPRACRPMPFFGLLFAADDSQARAETDDATLDQALIHACLYQDRNQYAKLVERYEPAVARILWNFTRDRAALEELIQDTFVEAYFSLRRFRAGAPFFPWLRVIATRAGYRYWRRMRRAREQQAALEQWQQETQSRRAANEITDTVSYLFGVLQLLPPKDRVVLTLQYFEECSMDEIAARMGWTRGMAKVRAFRARKRLKAILAQLEAASHE